MERRRGGAVAWKVLLYLVVAVTLGGLTRDLTLTALLTAGFAAGDGSLGFLLRSHAGARPKPDPAGTTKGPS